MFSLFIIRKKFLLLLRGQNTRLPLSVNFGLDKVKFIYWRANPIESIRMVFLN